MAIPEQAGFTNNGVTEYCFQTSYCSRVFPEIPSSPYHHNVGQPGPRNQQTVYHSQQYCCLDRYTVFVFCSTRGWTGICIGDQGTNSSTPGRRTSPWGYVQSLPHTTPAPECNVLTPAQIYHSTMVTPPPSLPPPTLSLWSYHSASSRKIRYVAMATREVGLKRSIPCSMGLLCCQLSATMSPSHCCHHRGDSNQQDSSQLHVTVPPPAPGVTIIFQ